MGFFSGTPKQPVCRIVMGDRRSVKTHEAKRYWARTSTPRLGVALSIGRYSKSEQNLVDQAENVTEDGEECHRLKFYPSRGKPALDAGPGVFRSYPQLEQPDGPNGGSSSQSDSDPMRRSQTEPSLPIPFLRAFL